VQGYSVVFDATAKAKLHHLLNQVRDIFLKLEVDDRKRDALISKLSDLEKEVDRPRTRFDAYAALAIEVADVAGEVISRGKILEVLDAVARVFGVAKNEETTRQLPAPTKPKQIEHKRPSRSEKRTDMDDDIPF
jgi:hypothetical protein